MTSVAARSASVIKKLEKLSADERAKLEYEAREKAIRDYNSQMNSALKRGMQKGIEKGIEKGLAKGIKVGIKQERGVAIKEMLKDGVEIENIMRWTHSTREEIESIQREKITE